MKKLRTRQGFGAVELFLIVVAVGVIISVAVMVVNRQKTSSLKTAVAAQKSEVATPINSKQELKKSATDLQAAEVTNNSANSKDLQELSIQAN